MQKFNNPCIKTGDFGQIMRYKQKNFISFSEFAYKEAVLDEITVQDATEYITRISIRIDKS